MLAEYLGVLIILAIALALAAGLLATRGSAGFGQSSGGQLLPRPRSAPALLLAALLFLVLDVAVVFVYPWAASFRALGMPGLVALGVFCLPLGVAIAYLWRRGALEW